MSVQRSATVPNSQGLQGPRGTVLLVDDEEDSLLAMGRNLLGSGHRVILARSASAALETLAWEPVNVVFAAVELAGMGGLELLDRVRERRPQAVRVVMSRHPDVASALAAINVEEVFRYLSKPVTCDELCSTLHLAMVRSQAASAKVVPLHRPHRALLTEEERVALRAASEARWDEPLAPLLPAHGGT